MSGLFDAVGKIFSSVGDVVKKIALPAVLVGATVMTGGAAAGAAPLLGGATAATAAGAGGLGSALTSALGLSGAGGGFGGFLGNALLGGVTSALTGGNPLTGALMGGLTGGGGLGMAQSASAATGTAAAASGGWGGLGSLFQSPEMMGNLLTGAAQGWAQGAELKELEEQRIREEEREQALYEGAGAAQAWGPLGQGLGAASAPAAMMGSTPAMQAARRPPRPGLGQGGGQAPARPRYRYEPSTGRIEYS